MCWADKGHQGADGAVRIPCRDGERPSSTGQQAMNRSHTKIRTTPKFRRLLRNLRCPTFRLISFVQAVLTLRLTVRNKGRTPKADRKLTVEQWMTTYLDDISSLKLKPHSLDDHRSKKRNDIIPGIGKHWLDKLGPEHPELMYRTMAEGGHPPPHVLKVQRILSRTPKIPTAACTTGADTPPARS